MADRVSQLDVAPTTIPANSTSTSLNIAVSQLPAGPSSVPQASHGIEALHWLESINSDISPRLATIEAYARVLGYAIRVEFEPRGQ